MSATPRLVGALVEKALSDALADERVCRAGFVPRDIAKLAVKAALNASEAALRGAADGRREYARGMQDADNLREMHAALEQEAHLLGRAADVVAGDLGPLYSWLPSWRWTDQMHADLVGREHER